MQVNINNSSSQFPLSNTISLGRETEMPIDEKDFVRFVSIKEGLDENSVNNCRKTIRLVNIWFINKEITKENIELFFDYLKNEKKLKPNTLNAYLFVLHHLVSYCKDRGLPYDFLEGFKSFKKTKSEIIIFTNEEREKIVNTHLIYGRFQGKDCSFLDFRYGTMAMFLAYTGCRFSEAANLKVKSVDFDGKARIVETKNNENRIVYFTEPLISKIKSLCINKNPDELVFLNASNNKVNAQDFSSDLKRRAKTAGITKRTFPHNFRHSWATHMLEEGVPIEKVATLGGWKDIQTLYGTYMHLADKTLYKAAMMHPANSSKISIPEKKKMAREAIENLHLRNTITNINETEKTMNIMISFTGI